MKLVVSHEVPLSNCVVGWLMKFLSHSVIGGFMSGAAITIGLGQAKYIFGFKIAMGSSTQLQLYLQQYIQNMNQLRWQEYIMGVTCIFILIAFKVCSCNGINSDSFLIRNTPEGRGFIDHLQSIEPRLRDHKWEDQQAIIESLYDFKNIIKILPQKDLNAYPTAVYNNQSHLDMYGNDGTWRPGDWLIHWPGLSIERRIWLAGFYKNYIIQ